MRRRVVKHGSSTLTISLPSNWVKRFGIKPGDELDITDERGNLVIRTRNEVDCVEGTRINLKDVDGIASLAVSALYRAGCDSIRIDYGGAESVLRIDAMVAELIGFEVMHQDPKGCLLKEISHPVQDVELDDMIKRTFLVLLSISKDLLDNISKNDRTVLESIIARDASVNKFTNFCRRTLIKQGAIRIKESPHVFYIVQELENLGDEYKYFAKYLLSHKLSITNKDVIRTFTNVHDLIHDYFMLYFKFSISTANHFGTRGKNVLREINTTLTAHEQKDQHALECLSRMCSILIKTLNPLLMLKLPDLCKDDYISTAGGTET